MPVATLIFKLSTLCSSIKWPVSIFTSFWQAFLTFVLKPKPSLPRTSTVGCFMQTSKQFMAFGSADAPKTCQPDSAAAASVLGRFCAECTGIASMAPALALLTTGDKGALLR